MAAGRRLQVRLLSLRPGPRTGAQCRDNRILAGGIEGSSQWFTLPLRCTARGLRSTGGVKRGELLLPARLAGRHLCDDGEEALAAGRDTAVGRVIAEPPGGHRNRSPATLSAAMWPVTRSTGSQGPRCQTQCVLEFAGSSPENSSLMPRTRRTTRLRTVNSCDSPMVHSLTVPSATRGRILRASSPVAAPAGSPSLEYGTRRTTPRATTALQGAALRGLKNNQRCNDCNRCDELLTELACRTLLPNSVRPPRRAQREMLWPR